MEALSNVWTALRALARSLVPHTADDAARRRVGSTTTATTPPALRVDREGRPRSPPLSPLPAATAASPKAPRPAAPCALGADAPPGHHPHGAIVGLAEGLERAVLAPAPPGAKSALSAAHEELEAERVGDPFRRAITPPAAAATR